MAVQASSVLWLHNMTCEACVCCSNLYDLYVSAWTKRVIWAKHWLAPWWWFPRKPKQVGAAFLILICFNKLHVCISWTIKRLISLTHGVIMKIFEEHSSQFIVGYHTGESMLFSGLFFEDCYVTFFISAYFHTLAQDNFVINLWFLLIFSLFFWYKCVISATNLKKYL